MTRHFPFKQAVAVNLIVLALGSGCVTRPGRGDAFAEPPAVGDPWDRVRALDQGSTIAVGIGNGKPVRGRLVSAGEEEITIAGDDAKAVTVSKSDIQTLHLEQRVGSGRKGLLIGAAIGAGAGAGIGVGVSEGIDLTTAITVPILVGVGAAVGALSGYLVGKSRTRAVLIYEAP